MDMDMDIYSVIWDGGWVVLFLFRLYFFIYICLVHVRKVRKSS